MVPGAPGGRGRGFRTPRGAGRPAPSAGPPRARELRGAAEGGQQERSGFRRSLPGGERSRMMAQPPSIQVAHRRDWAPHTLAADPLEPRSLARGRGRPLRPAPVGFGTGRIRLLVPGPCAGTSPSSGKGRAPGAGLGRGPGSPSRGGSAGVPGWARAAAPVRAVARRGLRRAVRGGEASPSRSGLRVSQPETRRAERRAHPLACHFTLASHLHSCVHSFIHAVRVHSTFMSPATARSGHA